MYEPRFHTHAMRTKDAHVSLNLSCSEVRGALLSGGAAGRDRRRRAWRRGGGEGVCAAERHGGRGAGVRRSCHERRRRGVGAQRGEGRARPRRRRRGRTVRRDALLRAFVVSAIEVVDAANALRVCFRVFEEVESCVRTDDDDGTRTSMMRAIQQFIAIGISYLRTCTSTSMQTQYY